MYNPEEECKELVSRIEAICRQRGITHYALAKKANISTSTLSCIMNGKTKPQVYTLLLLCNVLDVSMSELFDEKMAEAVSLETVSEEGTGQCLQFAGDLSENGLRVSGTGLSVDEEELLVNYRYFPKKKKEWVRACVDFLRQYEPQS